MGSFARAAVGLACAAALTAALGSARARAAGADVNVGVVFDITGSASVYGVSQQQGLSLAQEYVNKRNRLKVNFDIEDSASQKTQAINLFQKFTANGSSAIIGPTLSSEAFAADPIAVRAGVPVMGVSNTANGITAQGPCVFRDSLSEAQIVPTVIDEVRKRWNIKKVAIIYGNDDQFTKTDYEVFKKVLDDDHIAIVDTETFAKGDVDFSAQLTKIKSANPDAIVAGALAEEAAHIMSDARKLGISARFIGGNGFNSPKLIGLSGGAAEGAVVGAAWAIGARTAGNAEFVRLYRSKYQKDPDQFAAQAFAGAQIMSAAIDRAKSTSPADVCASLAHLGRLDTVIGPFAFDANRDASSQGVVLQVHGDRFLIF